MKTGAYTKIWNYCNIYDDVVIGNNCTIASYVEIGKGVKIGNFCSIQAFTFIPEGVTIGDNVFIGPHVCFINCRHPSGRKRYHLNIQLTDAFKLEKITVYNDVVIGANSTIMCGILIGQGANIGAGSMIVKDVMRGEKIIQKRIINCEHR